MLETKRRFGFKNKNQSSLFLIWEEYWVDNEVIFAKVIFDSYRWIRI
jgi:hypothetical protein